MDRFYGKSSFTGTCIAIITVIALHITVDLVKFDESLVPEMCNNAK